MLTETKELLKGFYGLDDETFKLSEEVMNDIKHKFDEIKETPKATALGVSLSF